MGAFLQRAFLGIAKDLAKEYAGFDSAESSEGAVSFIVEQIARVPWFLRTGILVATLAFALHRILHGLLSALNPNRRSLQPLTSRWRSSRLRICRDLMKFYTALFFLWQFSDANSRCLKDPA